MKDHGGRSWNKKLDQTLRKLQFKLFKADPCVIKRQQEKMVILGICRVYVDDMIMLSNNNRLLAMTKQELSKHFKMKDLGKTKHLLGSKVTRDEQRGSIWLDQEAYIEEMLDRFNMKQCKPVETPTDRN